MSKYTMSKAEIETHITWDEETKQANIFTLSPTVIRKLEKLARQCPDSYYLTREEDWCGNRAVYYSVPAKLVSFRAPRQLTIEQKEKAAARMKKYRARTAAGEGE